VILSCWMLAFVVRLVGSRRWVCTSCGARSTADGFSVVGWRSVVTSSRGDRRREQLADRGSGGDARPRAHLRQGPPNRLAGRGGPKVQGPHVAGAASRVRMARAAPGPVVEVVLRRPGRIRLRGHRPAVHRPPTGRGGVRRAYKFALRPTKGQHLGLQACLDDHRELYNAALQERRDAYERVVRRAPG